MKKWKRVAMANNIVFSGSLLFLSLGDVFQLLGGNHCSGTLTLRSQYSADLGIVYFMRGNPVNASWGRLKGLDAVYALFGWTDGKYEFSEEDLTGIDLEIKQGTMETVMGALRLLDDGEIVKFGQGPFDAKDMEKTGPDGSMMDFVHPIKGPLVDYRYVTIENHYTDGVTIVREGKPGKWLWVICEGTVRITRETPKGTITLARLGEGCFIGTMGSFLYGEYERSATAIAEGSVQLCILDIDVLYQEYSDLSPEFRKILLSLDNRLRMINDNAVGAYVGAYAKELPKNKTYEEKFQTSTDLYIIKKGTADIIGKGPNGDVNLLSLGRDDVFGKIPFMAFGHEPLSASVMTSKDFEADLLDSEALQQEYDHLSPTFRNFAFSSATNISMTTKLFYQLLNNPQSG
ncbi:MAG: cyclic nucleotide-binding domain-containing protein [Smithellaceae bacterium]